MIKCEVGFDDDLILVNGHNVLEIHDGVGYVFIVDEIEREDIKTLEQAIKYCLEN